MLDKMHKMKMGHKHKNHGDKNTKLNGFQAKTNITLKYHQIVS